MCRIRYYTFNKSNDKENPNENFRVDMFIKKRKIIKPGSIFVEKFQISKKNGSFI